jgi:hypothetical protein
MLPSSKSEQNWMDGFPPGFGEKPVSKGKSPVGSTQIQHDTHLTVSLIYRNRIKVVQRNLKDTLPTENLQIHNLILKQYAIAS